MTAGYQALREGAAWLDLDARGRFYMRGEDRARLLHAMCTNHIEQMKPADTCYTFFLNAQGRILADANVVCQEDALLLDTEPELHDKLYLHVDKYIIADDVALEDAREPLAVIGVEGPGALEVLSHLSGELKSVPLSYTGRRAGRLFVPRQRKNEVIAELERAGIVAASMADAEIVRLENFRPRFGADITEKNLVHETQLLHGIHFTKGCYLGQEIVERVRSRGQVHRLLVPLYVNGENPPAAGTEVTADGAAAGETMSSAYSPALQRCLAFAFIRAEHVQVGQALLVGGVPAEVAAPKGM